MTGLTENRTDLYLRFNRRSLLAVFLSIVALGGMLLTSALWPDGAVAQWLGRTAPLMPIVIVLAVAAHQSLLHRQGLRADAPEMKALLADEWRQANLDRACRVSLTAVLLLQAPLALALSQVASPRALPAMAVATVAAGLAVFVGSFLFYDRG